MRTIQRILDEVTRDAPPVRVQAGRHTYATIEVPGTKGAHVTVYLGPMDEDGEVLLCYSASDPGHRIAFKRGSRREDRAVELTAEFLSRWG